MTRKDNRKILLNGNILAEAFIKLTNIPVKERQIISLIFVNCYVLFLT